MDEILSPDLVKAFYLTFYQYTKIKDFIFHIFKMAAIFIVEYFDLSVNG